MKIDQNQLFVTAFYRNSCFQHTALKIAGFYRPFERFRKCDSGSLRYFVIRICYQAAFNFTNRRKRVWDIYAFEITCKDSIYTQCFFVVSFFVDVIRSFGINVYFLKKTDIGICIIQNAGNSFHIVLYQIFRLRHDFTSAVHKEIFVFAKSGISGIIGQNRHRISCRYGLLSTGCVQSLYLIRTVFQCCQNGNNRQENQYNSKYDST